MINDWPEVQLNLAGLSATSYDLKNDLLTLYQGKRSAEALLSLEARMCSQIRGNGFELTLWMTLMLTRRMAFGGLRF